MTLNTHHTLVSISLTVVLALAGCSDDTNAGGTGGNAGAGGAGGAGGTPEVPLRILVTNDDGFDAQGINELVDALIVNRANTVRVVAPLENQSGTGDMTNCGTLETIEDTTISGFPVTAVDGCPADAVNVALDTIYQDNPPDLVISGVNAGQNVGNIGPNGFLSQVSGTIGAAKTAVRRGVPALAVSQGDGEPIRFVVGVGEVLLVLSDRRDAIAAGEFPPGIVVSLNVPSCNEGFIRNPLMPLQVPLATENPNGFPLTGPQDCQSEGIEPDTDVNAFFTGWVTLSIVPAI